MRRHFFIEFLITDLCNESCPYCDLEYNNRNIQKSQEMDIDYFKYCINKIGQYSNNLMVELCGGEPGLISNLDDAILFLIDHKSVQKTQIMSNGLVRKNQPGLIKITDYYNEHLIKSIEDKNIIKFYDLEFEHFNNTRYVIVLDKITTSSLLNNFEYFDKTLDLFNEDKFWLKMFVERSQENSHKTEIIQLFKKINTDYAKYCIKQLTIDDKLSRRICALYPFLPTINLNTKKIIHCAYHNFHNQYQYDVTDDNLKKLIHNKLFNKYSPDYCNDCYLYNRDNRLSIINKKSNRLK